MWQPHFLLYLIPEFDRRNIIYFVFLLYAFVRHCNNSFFDNKNTAVSGDTAGVTKNLGNCAAIAYDNDISKCSFLQSCIYK